MRACGRPPPGPSGARCDAAHTARLDASAGRGPPRRVVFSRAARRRACRGSTRSSFSFASPRSSRTVRPRAVPPPEQSHSTQVDDDLSIDADADDDVSCASDSFDEDSTDDLPVGGTVDMDDAVRSTSTSSWSLRNLEGVMVGASWPLRQVAREVSQWSSSSFDDDDECDNTKRPMGRAIAYPAGVDTDDVGKDDGEASETKRDEKKELPARTVRVPSGPRGSRRANGPPLSSAGRLGTRSTL